MFRLKEQQLHMLIWLMIGACVLLFGIFGLEKIPRVDEKGSWKGLENFSDGWICTYETTDMDQLKEYQKTKETESDDKDHTIVDVVTFPATLSVKEGTSVSMLHQVPEMNLDTVYMTMELDGASVRVSVEGDVIYESSENEQPLQIRHIIPIESVYKDNMIAIEIYGHEKETVEIGSIQVGNYNQVWVTTLKEDGTTAAIGVLMICMALGMFLVWIIVKNTWNQKRVLLYCGAESMVLGMVGLLDGNILPLITGWNYGIYLLKACAIILAVILHLTIVRCFIYKKKILSIIDTGILLFGIFYISVVVLEFFALVSFETIYYIGLVLYVISLLLVTVVLAVTIYNYKRKEGVPVFIANILLILSILVHVVLRLAGRLEESGYICVSIGFLIYILYLCIYGMHQAFNMNHKKEEILVNEEQIREQVIEQLNPNLLFASFHTLQNLIKSGSSKSVKMLYYISVYFRDNLKALESAEHIISFEEELEHIIAYLQLQKTRNQNLDFSIECKVKEFNIPRHSLEPLVENAVKHGIAKNDNSGNVAVRTYMRADGYAVQIIDDGVGFDTGILKKQTLSLGRTLALLENVCQARTEVISKEGKGTVITIILPVLENDLMDVTDEIDVTEG